MVWLLSEDQNLNSILKSGLVWNLNSILDVDSSFEAGSVSWRQQHGGDPREGGGVGCRG